MEEDDSLAKTQRAQKSDFTHSRTGQTLVFSGLVLAALAAFLGFMRWGEYTRVDVAFDPRNLLSGLVAANLWLILGAVLLAIAFAGWLLRGAWRKNHAEFYRLFTLLVYLGAVLLTALPTLREVGR